MVRPGTSAAAGDDVERPPCLLTPGVHHFRAAPLGIDIKVRTEPELPVRSLHQASRRAMPSVRPVGGAQQPEVGLIRLARGNRLRPRFDRYREIGSMQHVLPAFTDEQLSRLPEVGRSEIVDERKQAFGVGGPDLKLKGIEPFLIYRARSLSQLQPHTRPRLPLAKAYISAG